MSKPWHRHFETIGSISAIVVGLAALVIAWDQGRVMRAQQHGEVFPALQVDAFTSTQEDAFSMGLRVANNGVGPAFIESAALYRDGEEQPVAAFFEAAPNQTVNRSWMAMNGRSLAPGAEIQPFVASWTREEISNDAIAALIGQWDHWDVRICYCSVFDRCWIASASTMAREPVEACAIPENDPFEDFGLAALEREDDES